MMQYLLEWKRRMPLLAAAALVFGGAGLAQAGPILHTTDFIADANRSHFNGFEQIPNDGVHYTGGGGPYIEDTIQVQQINGDSGNDIWVTSSFWTGFEGKYGWYPDGGDHGYTQLSLAGGGDFQDVGFNYGTGGSAHNILYEVLEQGVVVLSGTTTLTSGANYLGFSGGGFDTIRVRDDHSGSGGTVTNGQFQALAIDSIETQDLAATPEPASLTLLGLGALGMAGYSWRRRRLARQATV